MKLDICRALDVPAEKAFARLSDLDTLIGKAAGGHASLERVEPAGPVRVGTVWRGDLHIQGIVQAVELTLAEFEPPNRFLLLGGSEMLAARGVAEVRPTGIATSEVSLLIELKGKGFAARMLVNSLGFLRGKLEKRLTKLLDGLARPAGGKVRKNGGGRRDKSPGSSEST